MQETYTAWTITSYSNVTIDKKQKPVCMSQSCRHFRWYYIDGLKYAHSLEQFLPCLFCQRFLKPDCYEDAEFSQI